MSTKYRLVVDKDGWWCTERWATYGWFISGQWLYVSGSGSSKEEEGKRNFDRICKFKSANSHEASEEGKSVEGYCDGGEGSVKYGANLLLFPCAAFAIFGAFCVSISAGMFAVSLVFLSAYLVNRRDSKGQ